MLVEATEMLSLNNVEDGEEVYQRCVLVTGRCLDAPENSHVSILTENDAGKTIFPDQQWPMHQGYFKALLILNPGNNKITLRSAHNSHTLTVTLRYIPLLQTPPLHLAILVAKDSPLLIDCPPAKFAALSTAHSSLSAAIAKFRMTALMWQAVTAEEFRQRGLSRRAFRLEEEWTTSTLSSTHSSSHPAPPSASVPKVHLIRTDHTVATLREAHRAQQHPWARDVNSLHAIFSAALKAYGPPFSDGPVTVAGLILDSHYDAERDLILAHAALGAHDPAGLSLGMFGSHLTYAWPRFLEEVSDCLADSTRPGGTVGNDNGECGTMWEACAVGQGAFLHEVGHAFGAPHTSGIMERGYSPDWVKWFVSKVGYCSKKGEDGRLVRSPEEEGEEGNKCRWDVRDLLRFKALPGFALPGDGDVDAGEPVFEMEEEGDGVRVKCAAGIAVVMLNGGLEPVAFPWEPVGELVLKVVELEGRFDKTKPLELVVVGMNGKEKKMDVWKFMSSKSWIRVPGTNIRLLKKAVGEEQDGSWQWAVMLKKRGKHGKLVDASKIDVRVGCALDGAVVYYRDGTTIPCGPRGRHGDDDPGMGGHQAKKIAIRPGVEVVKVAVNGSSGSLRGLRIWLSDGNARGALNCGSDREQVQVLTPDPGQRIIGFYGSSYGLCQQFGIVTAPKDVELPDYVYDMEELQNKPEGQRSKRRRLSREDSSKTQDYNDFPSEDEDEGYDHESDVDDI
ncbi:putative peptidase family-domain-containing protein [Echria macrotheca]|uniref:Peptidase family-domain-containing protein n=1 Tax=Echria macrotheca TaxID=438768 RepID=A0AAJ0B591_9PEZI|nr:putative peptidase family-domain-containing protein [Echria macrotheca]